MISVKNYLSAVMLIITIFIMFMVVGRSADFINADFLASGTVDTLNISGKDFLTADRLNIDNADITDIKKKLYGQRMAAIISENNNGILTGLLTEWCVYNKYFYKIYDYLPEVNDTAPYSLLIFGDIGWSEEDKEILYKYAESGKTMIFTHLPDYRILSSDRDFLGLFGIDKVMAGNVKVDGFKIFSDFLISEERIYIKGDYFGEEDDTSFYVPYYKLAPGYEVYAVALFDGYEKSGLVHADLPPLLWRTRTGNSFVFVVGCDIFCGMALPGILTGFMTHVNEVYLYPVVNAQTISITDFPYLSDENSDKIKSVYLRSPKNLARDILWPNIVKILKSYGNSYNFFTASQLDYTDDVGPDGDLLKFYLDEIKKLGGTPGLSLNQVTKADIDEVLYENLQFYEKNMPYYSFSYLYPGKFKKEDFLKKMDHKLLKDITLIMADYYEGGRLIDLIENDILSVSFNLNGYRHETMDDLRLVCVENALGMCNMKVDLSPVIYPESSSCNWNNLSLKWAKGNTYFRDFTAFDTVSLSELNKRIRRFLALNFTCEIKDNHIHISIDNFDREAYFILITYDKTVKSVDNGSCKKIKDSRFLIKATDSDVVINLEDQNVLKIP